MPVGEPWQTKYPDVDCGELEYKVLLNGAPVEDDWVMVDANGEVRMAPTVRNEPGDYVFTLAARLDRYRNITAAQDFVVTVLPCQTGLDLSGLSLENQSRMWYQSALLYPVGDVLQQVREAPYQCGYGVRFEPRRVLGPDSFTDLPREVIWDPINLTFQIEKCHQFQPGVILDDPMCKDGTVPFEFAEDIVVIAILDDGTNRVASADLRFSVTILDPCVVDTIAFKETLSTIDYAIGTVARPYSGYPVYEHTYALCPVECELTMEGGSPVGAAMVTGLGLSLDETPQPVFSMSTADKYWSGFSARLSVRCSSLNSDADPSTPGLQNSVAVDSFTINVTDECSQTVIEKATAGALDTYLYQESHLPYTRPSQSLDCSAPEVALVTLATTSPDPTNCVVDPAGPAIVLNPTEKDDVGTYTFALKTCVSYVLNGASGASDVVCEESEPFSVAIADPCESANIVSAGFSVVMEKPQLQSASLNLNEQIVFENGYGSWPWTVDVDNNNPDPAFYGSNLCGEI